jgi:hypothetical protein
MWTDPLSRSGVDSESGSPPQITRARSRMINANPMVIRTCGKWVK